MPRPDPRGRRTSVGLDLAPYGRRGAQRIRAPSVHHCLALLDHPNALGLPSLSGQMGAPSAPPRADGGAHVNTLSGASVSQRMTCPVPALLARDTCHNPCHRGTSTGRSKRPAEAGGGVRGEGLGRGRDPGAVPEWHGRQPGRRGEEPPAPDPPHPPQGCPPPPRYWRAPQQARPDAARRRALSRGPGHACTVPPPPPPVGTATPSRSAPWVQLSTMTRRHVAYPPHRALPPPSPYRMGRRGSAAA